MSRPPRHRRAAPVRPRQLAGVALLGAALAALPVALAGAVPSTAVGLTAPSDSPTSRPLGARSLVTTVTTTGTSSQLITVRSRGTRATVTALRRTATGWQRVLTTRFGRVGVGGVVPWNQRRQLSGTTPAGGFAMTETFGVAPNPGTRMRYRHLSRCDWWDQDTRSRNYNNRVNVCRTRPDFPLTERGRYGSEHLARHAAIYRWAVVIDFNRPNPVRGRGAGIFLHVNNSRATTGCVSVPYRTMRAILRWLNPASNPRITIR